MNLEQLNPIDFFLAAYFFQLENLLNQEQNALGKVKFQSEEAKKNEKWFNNAIRLFAIKFLDYTQNLEEEELNDLYENLKKLTDK